MRNRLKRLLPAREHLTAGGGLSIIDTYLHNRALWHFDRRTSSLGLGIGLFCAFLPVPFQMLVAAILAALVGANLALAIIGVWLTNPLTMAPIYYGAYRIGAMLMGLPVQVEAFRASPMWLWDTLVLIWQPLLLGCLVCGVLAGLAGHAGMLLLWRLLTLLRWRRRHTQR